MANICVSIRVQATHTYQMRIDLALPSSSVLEESRTKVLQYDTAYTIDQNNPLQRISPPDLPLGQDCRIRASWLCTRHFVASSCACGWSGKRSQACIKDLQAPALRLDLISILRKIYHLVPVLAGSESFVTEIVPERSRVPVRSALVQSALSPDLGARQLEMLGLWLKKQSAGSPPATTQPAGFG